MQIKSPRVTSYNRFAVADSTSEEARACLKQLERVRQLNPEGCSAALCPHAIDCSRATCYRWLKR